MKVSVAEALERLEGPFEPLIVVLRALGLADDRAEVLLIEPRGTVNTGDAGGPLTAPERSL